MSTWVSLSNPWPRSWDRNHPIKKIMKPNLLISQYRRIKLKIKFNFKKGSKAKKNSNQKNEYHVWHKNRIIGHLYFFDKSTNIEERRNKRERKEKKGYRNLTTLPSSTCVTSLERPHCVVFVTTDRDGIFTFVLWIPIRNSPNRCEIFLPDQVWVKPEGKKSGFG
jgi:hypothetical protein